MRAAFDGLSAAKRGISRGSVSRKPGSGLFLPVASSKPTTIRLLHRIEFAGVIFHITSCGDGIELNFHDVRISAQQPTVIAHAMERFDARVIESGVGIAVRSSISPEPGTRESAGHGNGRAGRRHQESAHPQQAVFAARFAGSDRVRGSKTGVFDGIERKAANEVGLA